MIDCVGEEMQRRGYCSMWRRISVIGLAGGLLGTAACGGGGAASTTLPDNDPNFVGAVPRAEFEAVPPPNYDLLADAYGRTLRDQPTSLHLDAAKFSRKLFDMVKSLTPSGAPQRGSTDSGTTLLSLSPEEWRLAIAEPVGTYQTFLAKQTTENVIDEIYGQDGRERNDKVDAFRLTYWNALSVQKLKGIFLDPAKCVETVKRVTEAHVKAGQTAREIQMDLNNGTVGRKLIVDNMNATTSELKTICSTVPSEYLSPATSVMIFDFRTVYFAGWTNIDGAWSGQLTNADSEDNTPWDATLYVTYFGGKVRGELHLYRGDQFALRRFTGDTDFSAVNLNFLYPYKWELGGTSPCIGMTSTVHSAMSRLTGTWQSSSCPQGGNVTLERGVGMPNRRPGPIANTGCPCST
jgi:hypothetical protein